MKKLMALFVSVTFMLTLAGCGGKITPEKAFGNLQGAQKGTIAVKIKVSGETDGEKVDLTTNVKAIFGTNKEKTKMGFGMGMDLDLGSMNKTEGMPSKVAGMLKVYYDGTGTEKKCDVTAGIDKATALAIGQGLTAPVLITLNYNDLKSVIDAGLTGLNKDTSKELETTQEMLKMKGLLEDAFKGFNMPEPKDLGDASLEVAGTKFEGNQYDYELNEAVTKDILSRFVKFTNAASKSGATGTEALDSTSVKEFEDSMNDLDLSKPSKLTILVGKDGFVDYVALNATLKPKKETGYLDFEIAFGAKDLEKDVDGTDYYKTTVEKELPNYADAMVIPGSQLGGLLTGMPTN